MAHRDTRLGLADRATEIELIEEAFDRLQSGRGVLLLFEGSAGLGKTALLAHAGQVAAARGFTVVHGRGIYPERDHDWGVARQLFEPLSGLVESRSGRLHREVRTVVDHGTDAAGYGFIHALYRAVRALALAQPTVIVVDDLEWCDRPSLRLLAYLAARVESLPVAIVASVRRG